MRWALLVVCVSTALSPLAVNQRTAAADGKLHALVASTVGRAGLSPWIDERPQASMWDAFLTQLFLYLDQNSDGRLQADEARRSPAPEVIDALLRGDVSNIARSPSHSQAVHSLVPDCAVPTFIAAYRRAACDGLVLRYDNSNSRETELVDRVLFSVLSGNLDRPITRDHSRAAARVLHHFDIDDDERISAAELKSDAHRLATEIENAPSLTTIVFERLKYGPRHMRTHVPRLPDLRSGQEGMVPFEPFNACIEVSTILAPATDISLPWPGWRWLSAGDENALLCASEAIEIRGLVTTGAGTTLLEAARQELAQQLETDDANNDGSLDAGEIAVSPWQATWKALAITIDDEGGRIDREELDRYLNVLLLGAACRVEMIVETQGPVLFQTLDVDRDERLSLRELSVLWPRVCDWDRNQDGAIAWTEVPCLATVRMSLGPSKPRPRSMATLVAAPPTGPLWFRKMDRNGDGDVSPREFLGPAEVFKKLDRDTNGLIDPIEAGSAER